MGSLLDDDWIPNTTCTCKQKCCYLAGCCCKRPMRRRGKPPVVQPYTVVMPPAVYANRQHAGPSFLDLPVEVRHIIYRIVLLTQKVFDLSLNPRLRLRSPDNTWGSRNRFALLSTCRQIYHDGSPLAYGDNIFRIDRGAHRDFVIPRAPGMPFHHIRYLILHYPRWFGACTWSLAHTWEHWLQDALYVTSRFRHLKHLILQVSYLGSGLGNLGDLESWQPVFQLGNMKPKRFTKRVRRVVRGMAQINGRRMPACVRIEFDDFISGVRPDHSFEAINIAIPLAFGKYISLHEYMALYPSWRAEED